MNQPHIRIHARERRALAPTHLRQPAETHHGAPEWMVSYADMITIMLSFFVVMFSVATGETGKGKRAKQQAAIESLQYRFGPSWKPFSGWTFLPGGSLGKEKGVSRGVQPSPPSEGDAVAKPRSTKHPRTRIRVPGQGELLAVGGPVDFESETAEVPPQQQDRLQAIADELAGKPQRVDIVCVASGRPLPPGSVFHDRWDLAYARCRKTAELLATMHIEPERFQITVLPAAAPPDDQPASQAPSDRAVEVYLSETLPADDARLR